MRSITNVIRRTPSTSIAILPSITPVCIAPIRSFATSGSNIHSFLANRGKGGKDAGVPAAAKSALGDQSSSHQRLRAVLPERKPNPNALYDPPYPKNTLGEFGNYAIDLYKDAKAAGEDASAVSKQLEAFQEALASDADLNDMLILPPSKGGVIREAKGGIEIPFMKGKTVTAGTPPAGLSATKADRDARLSALFTKLKFSKSVQTFIRNLAEIKGALNKIPRLQALFDELARYERNEVLVTVKTVEPLGKEQLTKLKTKLKSSTAAGQKLVFKEEVDPKILGGLVIFYGDKTQDLSVITRVRNLQKMLQSQKLQEAK